MTRLLLVLTLAFGLGWPSSSRAGEIVRIDDPRYFQNGAPVVFPDAEVKLVILEFDAPAGDSRGKDAAKKIHDAYLQQIQPLANGAVVSFISGKGKQISNFRVEAETMGKAQKATMVLWGRVVVDPDGRSRVAARLSLLQVPPGIEARYQGSPSGGGGVPTEVNGVISAPVGRTRIDFAPVEDPTLLVPFLSGLAYYEKGSVREGSSAVPWLNRSVERLSEFVNHTSESVDASTLAQAHLYIARALVHLSTAASAGAAARLADAEQHAADAGRLNPYDPGIPPTQAVIAQLRKASPATVRAHLNDAVQLAPTSQNASVNLAVFDAARGQKDQALKTMDRASEVGKILQRPDSPEQVQVTGALRKSMHR
jgi:hypothetical protein